MSKVGFEKSNKGVDLIIQCEWMLYLSLTYQD